MAYVDLNTIHNPSTGAVIPAAWGDQVRDNQEFLARPPACSVYHSTTTSVSSSSTTTLAANSENYDLDAMHSTSTNNSRITAQTSGRYDVLSSVQFPANATGIRQVVFVVNNTTTYQGMLIATAGSGNSTVITANRKIILTAGDYVECRVLQTSGSSLSVTLLEFAASLESLA